MRSYRERAVARISPLEWQIVRAVCFYCRLDFGKLNATAKQLVIGYTKIAASDFVGRDDLCEIDILTNGAILFLVFTDIEQTAKQLAFEFGFIPIEVITLVGILQSFGERLKFAFRPTVLFRAIVLWLI